MSFICRLYIFGLCILRLLYVTPPVNLSGVIYQDIPPLFKLQSFNILRPEKIITTIWYKQSFGINNHW